MIRIIAITAVSLALGGGAYATICTPKPTPPLTCTIVNGRGITIHNPQPKCLQTPTPTPVVTPVVTPTATPAATPAISSSSVSNTNSVKTTVTIKRLPSVGGTGELR